MPQRDPCPFRTTRLALAARLLATLLAALAAGFALLAAPMAAAAQQAARAIDLPAQPLETAIPELARQLGQPIAADAALLRGRQAPTLKGSFTPAEALRRLLAGSGLEAVAEGGVLVLRRAAASPAAAAETALPEVRVRASTEPLPSDAPKPYAGGQVARGGAVGLLGNLDYMETPFSVTAYTAELLQSIQAVTVIDVLRLDPSITLQGPASLNSFYLIRGFNSQVGSVRLNGLKGIAGEDRLLLDAYERVQIIKGPTALLNGGAGDLGGTIDVQTKRAADVPLTEFTARYTSKSQVGGHLDLGRRFGVDNAFGVRGNVSYSDGRAEIDRESRSPGLASMGADYRGERLRVGLDLIYQRQDSRGNQGDLAGFDPDVLVIPDPANVRRGFAGNANVLPVDRSVATNFTRAGRVEYDLNPGTTAHLAYGELTQHTYNARPSASSAASPPGSQTYDLQQQDYENQVESFDAGLRGTAVTGAITHGLALSFTQFERTFGFGSQTAEGAYSSPLGAKQPSDHSFGGVRASPLNATQERSVGLADTMSLWDRRLALTLGLRRQQIEQRNFDFPPFGQPASRYAESATTGSAGLVVKPTPWLSIYGNYIEGLEAGFQVPNEAGQTADGHTIRYANAGFLFPPYKSKQVEAGAKVDFGTFGATLAVYQIERPGLVNEPTNDPLLLRQTLNGEQRNRGIEVTVFGEPQKGLRVLGAMSVIDARLQKTQDGLLDGNFVQGVPRRGFNLNVENDVTSIPGLTLTGNLSAKSSQFVDQNNAQQIKAWVIADVGLQYRLRTTVPVLLKAQLRNAFDRQYYATTAFGFLGFGEPRTAQVSATMSF